MKIIILISILTSFISCSITKRSFKKLNTYQLNKIDNRFNDYVIHFEYPFYRTNKKISGNINNGVIDSLKNCQIANKKINLYGGFSKFLNNSSESIYTLTDNTNNNKLIRIDLHLFLDDEQNIHNLIPQSKLLYDSIDPNDFQNKLINFNLYHYSLTNPILNFEFVENSKYTPPRLEKVELEEYLNFGKLVGKELCDALKNI
ncbi:hypothetical protein [Leptospira terpstrae]|uniref:Lipoprotein n=1 Tax=Leptospira terpstrae serovar Hualin str. LT 11-33 = ATCC 700639 TaxID=1257025 RepID=N1VKC6_9LEPT|nr:hypothetical protein [Leptospira terpstrae]EMY60189.1 putative lipoprotein [Leptospira terpstrae serovar Hualin str. LT 11-33 = ATCC 700639]